MGLLFLSALDFEELDLIIKRGLTLLRSLR
jgi:hypothetical protein